MASLREHAWPGNIRELGNYLERCLAFDLSTSGDAAQVAGGADGADGNAGGVPDGVAGADATTAASLDTPTPEGASDGRSVTIDFELPYREAKKRVQDAFERRYIAELLRRHDGNGVRAAAAAGIGREYCHRLIKAHGIEKQGGS